MHHTVALVVLLAFQQASTTSIPAPWLDRSAAGHLVYSSLPIDGPSPNFGNGFLAAQFPANASTAHMFIAGVFTGGLPPPFGREMGSVSQRAVVPLPLVQVSGGEWQVSALANDFELATIEEYRTNTRTESSVLLRHYFHRAQRHLFVSEVMLPVARSTTWAWKTPDASELTSTRSPSGLNA